MADKLLVATKSFITTDEDGRRIVVRAGKSRFRESHPIAQQFAAAFKDADTQPDVETARSDVRPKRAAKKAPAKKVDAKKSETSAEQTTEGETPEVKTTEG